MTCMQLKAQPEVIKMRSPDLYHFKVQGLQKLIQAYGVKSSQMRDALVLLQQVLDEVSAPVLHGIFIIEEYVFNTVKTKSKYVYIYITMLG